MKPIVCAFIAFLTTLLRSRLSLQIEIVALRHQLAVMRDRPGGHALTRATVFSGLGYRATGPGGATP
jgi:hypothetical protein